MEIKKVTGDKKVYLELLLLADEQESMIDRYLGRGEMFLLSEGEAAAECVVTREAEGVYEIKNIAVSPRFQKRGYGRALIEYAISQYPDCRTLLVGTGDVPSTLGFYQKCGFCESHRIVNFFTDNYDHPMFEDGKQLVDMVYLKREIPAQKDLGGKPMENDELGFVKEFYRALESGINELPAEERERLYRPCAEGCVKRYVLAEQKRQFEECGCDLDAQYEKYGSSPYFFADIVERGHIYEIGYPVAACVCPMVSSGIAESPAHCECSRQSMLCVLKTLLPEKHITAVLLHSALTGAKECRFRVTVE